MAAQSMAQRGPARVIVGVDTHKDVHVASAKDELGRALGQMTITASAKGYRALLSWSRRLGQVQAFGVEGTGCTGPAWHGTSVVLHEGTGPTVADLKQLVKTHGVKRVNLTGLFVEALGIVHEANDTLDLETYSDAFCSQSLRVVPDDSIADRRGSRTHLKKVRPSRQSDLDDACRGPDHPRSCAADRPHRTCTPCGAGSRCAQWPGSLPRLATQWTVRPQSEQSRTHVPSSRLSSRTFETACSRCTRTVGTRSYIRSWTERLNAPEWPESDHVLAGVC